jgi:hypothetical protein
MMLRQVRHHIVVNTMMLNQAQASNCTFLHMRVIITAFFSLATLQSFGPHVLQGRICTSKTSLVAPAQAEHSHFTLS